MISLREKRADTLLVLSALLAAFSSFSIAQESAAPCKEFSRLLAVRSPNGIDRYQLEASIPVGGNLGDERYFNIDIDGDDINDSVTLSCPSGSMPADPCGLWVQLSSGKKIEFHQDRFFLIRYHSKIYAVSAEMGPNRHVGQGKIWRVDGSGVKLVCEKL
jgi:hypothetical protein